MNLSTNQRRGAPHHYLTTIIQHTHGHGNGEVMVLSADHFKVRSAHSELHKS